MTPRIIAAAAALALAACGGGGGSSPAPAPPVPTTAPTATPTATPPPIVNTANPFMLPKALGNRWTFATGGAIVDQGPVTVICACAINGLAVEALDTLAAGSLAYSGTLYFVESRPTGHVIDELVGTSTNHGANVAYLIDLGTGKYGIPVMDDPATAGESFTAANEQSTITAVNQTQALANGSLANQVNTDVLTGAAAFTWNFARGIGFTAITLGGQSTVLSSFTVNAAASTSSARTTPQALHPLSVTAGDLSAAAAAISSLLK